MLRCVKVRLEGPLLTLKDNMIQRYILWRLYHLTSEINESTRKIEEANERLTGLRSDLVSPVDLSATRWLI